LSGSIGDNCKVLDVLFTSLSSYDNNRDERQVIAFNPKQKKAKISKKIKKIMFLL
jgi:hypothetical protein